MNRLFLSTLLMVCSVQANANDCYRLIPAEESGDQTFAPFNCAVDDDLLASVTTISAMFIGVSGACSDLDSRRRRLANSMKILKLTKPGPQGQPDWFEFVEPLDSLAVHPDVCPSLGTAGGNWIRLAPKGVRGLNLVERTMLVAHEARHTQSIAHSGSCPADSSCDTSFWDNGANAYSVRSWEAIANHVEGTDSAGFPAPKYFIEPWIVEQARHAANYRLNNRFEEHPGFNLSDRGPGNERVYWDIGDYSDVYFAFFPDPDSRWPLGLTRIELRLENDDLEYARFFSRRIGPEGVMAAGESSAVGPNGDFANASLQATPGYVFTELTLKALPSGTSALISGVERQVLREGMLGEPRIVTQPVATPIIDPDAVLRAPEGQFISGMALGLGRHDKLSAVSYRTSFPKAFITNDHRRFDQETAVVACNPEQVAIGASFLQDDEGITGFGIICTTVKAARGADPYDPNDVTFLMSSSESDPPQPVSSFRYHSEYVRAGHKPFYCEQGHVFAGLVSSWTRIPSRMRHVYKVNCRPIGETTGSASSWVDHKITTEPYGMGDVSWLECEASRSGAGVSVRGFAVNESGPLDSLALLCQRDSCHVGDERDPAFCTETCPCAAGVGNCPSNVPAYLPYDTDACESGLQCRPIDSSPTSPWRCQTRLPDIGEAHYCDPSANSSGCGYGEGHCADDGECQGDLRCEAGHEVRYGLPLGTSICVGPPELSDCSTFSPCTPGKPDCARDSDCTGRNFCIHNAGGTDDDVCGFRDDGTYPGSVLYCRSGPCGVREPDCSMGSCLPGLSCIEESGPVYVCASHESEKSFGDWGYCGAGDRCQIGEGDCLLGAPNVCDDGLVCEPRAWADYELWAGRGACVPKDATCAAEPCSRGHGNCKDNNECMSGLTCQHPPQELKDSYPSWYRLCLP